MVSPELRNSAELRTHCGGAGGGGAFPRRPTSGRLCGADGEGASVGTSRLPRTYHETGLEVAQVGPGAGGDEAGEKGPQAQELLHADPQAKRETRGQGGRGAEARGDLVGEAEALASAARRLREREIEAARASAPPRGPLVGTGDGDSLAGSSMRRYGDWAGAPRRISCTVRGRTSDSVRMGVCNARELDHRRTPTMTQASGP